MLKPRPDVINESANPSDGNIESNEMKSGMDNIDGNTDDHSAATNSYSMEAKIQDQMTENCENPESEEPSSSCAINIEPKMKSYQNDCIKPKPVRVWFQDDIKFYSRLHGFKAAKKADCDISDIAVVLAMTTRFVLDLEDYRYKYKTTFVSIVNSHIKGFSLMETDAVDKRLQSMCTTTRSKHRLKLKQGTMKHRQNISAITQFTVFKSEVVNVANVNFEDFISDPIPVADTDTQADGDMYWDSHIRFQDPVAFTPLFHKNGNNRYHVKNSEVALALNMTNRFLLDLHNSHSETRRSYISILNPHIKAFDLIESDRQLEVRLRNLCERVEETYKKRRKPRSGKRIRIKHPLALRQIRVLRSEIRNFSGIKFGNFSSHPPANMEYSSDADPILPIPYSQFEENKPESFPNINELAGIVHSSDTILQGNIGEIKSEQCAVDNTPGIFNLEMNVGNIKEG